MKILALDTSADTVSVALCSDGKTICSFTGNVKKTHSGTLLPIVDGVLGYSGVKCPDIDAFAVSVGPGSFTGLRIGVATVKGLAFASDKPAIGVSTLMAMAYNFCDREGALVCPVINARRNEVYCAIFRISAGMPIRITDDISYSAVELEERLLSFGCEVLFCGDGVSVLRSCFTRMSVPVENQLLLYPNAVSVAAAALDTYSKGGEFSANKLSPVYLKQSQAERERLEKIKSEN